ncbi:MAG: glycosyltransferase [Microscillaceae bacterium]|nr:glycosyltransferase [Microscillaceae bacterium]
MKVLHILSYLNFSGAEIMLKIAAPFFEENGIETHILNTSNDLGVYAPEMEAVGYTVHHISFYDKQNFKARYQKLLKEQQFDVVHIHRENSYFAFAWYAKQVGVKKVVRTVHNIFGYLLRKKKLSILKRSLQRFMARKILGVRFTSIGDSVAEAEKGFFQPNDQNCELDG